MEAHVAAMSWNAVEATGWDHSVEREPEIVHAGADRFHIAGGWTRYTKENAPILSTYVTYVVTRIGASWGIQSRFAVDPGPAGLSDRARGNCDRRRAAVPHELEREAIFRCGRLPQLPGGAGCTPGGWWCGSRRRSMARG